VEFNVRAKRLDPHRPTAFAYRRPCLRPGRFCLKSLSSSSCERPALYRWSEAAERSRFQLASQFFYCHLAGQALRTSAGRARARFLFLKAARLEEKTDWRSDPHFCKRRRNMLGFQVVFCPRQAGAFLCSSFLPRLGTFDNCIKRGCTPSANGCAIPHLPEDSRYSPRLFFEAQFFENCVGNGSGFFAQTGFFPSFRACLRLVLYPPLTPFTSEYPPDIRLPPSRTQSCAPCRWHRGLL